MAGPGPYGSVGTDYREMQGPDQVDTDLPNSEAGARAAALGGVFKEFEGISGDIYNEAQTKAGALAGAAAGATGHPQYRQGLERFTAYSRAFNTAATGAYAVEAEAQADDAAARLREQANNNPATFQATYSAVRDGVLKNAPAMAVPMLQELYNKRLAEGMTAISGAQAAQQIQTARAMYDVGVERDTSRVAELQGSLNPQDQLEAADQLVKLTAKINGGVNAGLYSPAEATAMLFNAHRAITQQIFETQFDREIDPHNPNGDPIALLERFRGMHIANLGNTNEPVVLSENEFNTLMSNAKQKLQQQRLIDFYGKSQGKTAEEVRFEAGDQKYTTQLLQGNLSVRALADAVRNQELKPEVARTLRMQLEQGPVLRSDPKAYLAIASDPRLLDMTPEEIATQPNISNVDKIKLGQQADRARNNWEGTQSVKQAREAIDAALKIPTGTSAIMLSDAERSARTNAQQDFVQRMQALDPAKRDSSAQSVAHDVIQHQHQLEAQAQLQNLIGRRQYSLSQHGPGAADEWGKDKLAQQLKQLDDQIAVLRKSAGNQ